MPFANFRFDGLMGLGVSTLALDKTFSIISQFTENHALRDPVFSVFFSDQEGETSEVTFGGVVKDHMASELFWVPLTSMAGYWEVQIEEITLNGVRQGVGKDIRVAVDSGTSLLAGPSVVIKELLRRVDVNPDCSNFESLPKLGFIIGGRILSLTPDEYVRKPSDTVCRFALMSLDFPPPSGPIFILGIPFLQKYYTVYDEPNRRVGFAAARHKGQEPEVLVEVGAPSTEVALAAQPELTVQHLAKDVHQHQQLHPKSGSTGDFLVQQPFRELQPQLLVDSKANSNSGFLAVTAQQSASD